jgi:signal transduction histidine kinase
MVVPSTAPASGFHIVFVDDDAMTREYIAQILRPLGRVDTFPDGSLALAAIRRELPDLLVTDVRMPGLDGLQLLRALRDDERTKTVPVIMLSGRSDDESRLESMTSGADDFLVKPFSARELFARVQSLLVLWRERKQAIADLRAAQEQLESQVEARTRELGDALTSLRLEMAEHHRTEAARVGLLRRLVKAQEDERRRIARDLHDHMGQQLTALRHQLETLEQRSAADPRSLVQIEHTLVIARQIEADIDFLAWELRPALLDDLGLRVALADYVERWSAHAGVYAVVHSTGLDAWRPSQEIETNLFRVAQEALHNISKHANASRVEVLLDRRGREMVLIIEDDGAGFDPSVRLDANRGMGLDGMHERAALIGGRLEVESEPGRGTTVFMRVPIGMGAGGGVPP